MSSLLLDVNDRSTPGLLDPASVLDRTTCTYCSTTRRLSLKAPPLPLFVLFPSRLLLLLLSRFSNDPGSSCRRTSVLELLRKLLLFPLLRKDDPKISRRLEDPDREDRSEPPRTREAAVDSDPC